MNSENGDHRAPIKSVPPTLVVGQSLDTNGV